MRISICCTDEETIGKIDRWVAGFEAALPGAVATPWVPGAAPADYAVVWKPPQAFFDGQTQLKGIFNTGAGVDALLRLRLPAGVPVVRLDDAGMAVQMAEYVCHAVIRQFRDFAGYEADATSSRWDEREAPRREDFSVGVLGLGVLGERVARAVAGFEFPVLGWSRTPRTVAGVRCFSGDEGLAAFLAATRVLVCLLPLTPQTENILNRQTLDQLRPDAWLINVARGAHLVEDDLLALLDSGRLAGATLDVFRTEPLPAGHAFWKHPKIRVTPHISARTLRHATTTQIAGKIAALEGGRPIASIAGVVDVNQGY
ncbi:MAG: glyoxylate/hydroxypyruvate reductase A [Polaromonas sp.]|nr:glyoxylate/hydroxypyruvate reductase A [Polaromonas sp.]